MPAGGELHIEAKKEGDTALVIISDTGSGMDRGTLEQCFDPFFTTKSPDKGTGLGLSTAYGIVKDHDGEIHVFSEPDRGTTFKLYFPLAVSEKASKEKRASGFVKGSGQKVLIVDDEIEFLKAIETALNAIGYTVTAVTSGKEAIAKYTSWRPDVVLLDRNMPEMDGITCAQKILEHDPGAKIVIMSGYDEGRLEGIDDSTATSIMEYLTKPIDMPELNRVLGRLCHPDYKK
jgi:CheY-like chemotaxis protein